MNFTKLVEYLVALVAHTPRVLWPVCSVSTPVHFPPPNQYCVLDNKTHTHTHNYTLKESVSFCLWSIFVCLYNLAAVIRLQCIGFLSLYFAVSLALHNISRWPNRFGHNALTLVRASRQCVCVCVCAGSFFRFAFGDDDSQYAHNLYSVFRRVAVIIIEMIIMQPACERARIRSVVLSFASPWPLHTATHTECFGRRCLRARIRWGAFNRKKKKTKINKTIRTKIRI